MAFLPASMLGASQCLLTPLQPALCAASGELYLPGHLPHMQLECVLLSLAGVCGARDNVPAAQAREARQALRHPCGAQGADWLRAFTPADHAFCMLGSTLLCCSMRAGPLYLHLSGTCSAPM